MIFCQGFTRWAFEPLWSTVFSNDKLIVSLWYSSQWVLIIYLGVIFYSPPCFYFSILRNNQSVLSKSNLNIQNFVIFHNFTIECFRTLYPLQDYLNLESNRNQMLWLKLKKTWCSKSQIKSEKLSRIESEKLSWINSETDIILKISMLMTVLAPKKWRSTRWACDESTVIEVIITSVEMLMEDT